MRWDELRPGDVLVQKDTEDPLWVVVSKKGNNLGMLSLIIDGHAQTIDLRMPCHKNGPPIGRAEIENGWDWVIIRRDT